MVEIVQAIVQSYRHKPLDALLIVITFALSVGLLSVALGWGSHQQAQLAPQMNSAELRELAIVPRKFVVASETEDGPTTPLTNIGRVGDSETLLREEDLSLIKQKVGGVAHTYLETLAHVAERDNTVWGKTFEVRAVTREFIAAHGLTLTKGAWPTAADFVQRLNSIVLSSLAARERFGGQNPIGQPLTLLDSWSRSQASTYQVVAVFDPPVSSIFRGTDNPQGSIGFVPMYTGTGVVFYAPEIRDLRVMPMAAQHDQALAALRDFVATQYGPSILVTSSERERSRYRQTRQVVIWLALIFGLIALFLAGCTATILLLGRVWSRQKQIGISLAIGASRAQIMRQIVCEAFLLGSVGGFLGLGVAQGMSYLLTQPSASDTFDAYAPGGLSLLLAWSLGALVSLLFGFIPAYASVQRRPVDLLRQ